MSKLIIMSGIPGSGKTTYALGVKSILPKVAIISSDEVRRQVTGRADDGTQETKVWQEFEKRIIAASSEYDIVIADSTALTNLLRMRWLQAFRPHFDKIELVYLNIPFGVCWERNIARERMVPIDPMAGMFKLLEEPDEEVNNNFDSIIVIKEEEKTTWKKS
ncbi:MAG: ATP-binding protein [Bacilli bacterium]|jgi:tRNA uridine 5-carbamoylmethylation protein Kti12